MSGPPPGRGSGRGGGRGSAGRGRGRGQGPHRRGTFGQHHQQRDSGYTSRQHRNDGSHNSMIDGQNGSLSCEYVDESPATSSAELSSAPIRCTFRTSSALALMLHKADRHLIYPEGGIEELKRYDPMLIAEQREQQRRIRQQQRRAPHPLPSRPRTAPSLQKQSVDQSASSSDLSNEEDSDKHLSDDESSSDDDDTGEIVAARPKDADRMLDGPADATISGLNIQLDTPELIAEWINQRKKRWPTQEVVQQKLKEKEERQRRSEMIYGPRPSSHGKRPRDTSVTEMAEAASASAQRDKRPRTEIFTALQDRHPAETAIHKDEDESDADDAPEELSSKVPVIGCEKDSVATPEAEASNLVREAKQDRRPICTHFLQGRCSYGDRCKKRHETQAASAPSSSSHHQSQQQRQFRRPHPRPPPVNPFDQPDLLRQLLRTEIEKHVDAVGQAIRFIVDNDMLLHVETEEGQAEEQRQRRRKIQIVSSGSGGKNTSADGTSEDDERGTGASLELPDELGVKEPLNRGGMAVIKPTTDGSDDQARASLYRPSSPILRALSELKYPPEPDPLIFLDPLRRDDPKPLMPSQLVRIAKDPVIRSVLTPSTPLHPNGHRLPSLERAVVSLDALPTDFYRNAAIEMILGIASASGSNAANSAAPAGGLVVTSKDGRRKVSETDLFRLGLRVGGEEVLAIKKLADRLSVLLGSSLQLDEVGETDWALLTQEQREEMRRLHYSREADRLEKLRKLGIDI